jgi:peptidoglycan/xylan/chitin deacetylase (PgdA/CDA1 family)
VRVYVNTGQTLPDVSLLADGAAYVYDGAISGRVVPQAEPYALPLNRWPAIYDGITFDHAAIALDFDDGPDKDSTVVGPLLKARNMVAGFGLVSGLLNTTGYLTTAQAQQLQADGNEMKCHSATHTDITGTLAQQWTKFVAETQDAQTALQALGFFADAFTEPVAGRL